MRIRVLNSEPAGYSCEALRVLREFADVDAIACDRQQLIERIGSYDGLIVRLGHRVDSEVMAAAPRLKFIATATTGLNHIDLREAARRKIDVISLRGERAFLDTIHATAEHTWALLLALIRRLPHAVRSVHDGAWDRDLFIGSELHGKTLGIVGCGRLGSKAAGYGLAFGMRVLAHDPHLKDWREGIASVSLERLAHESDVISLHVPSNDETAGMIGASFLANMKPGAVLINTARGEVVDEAALLSALKDGKIGGAALDVLCAENAGTPGWVCSDNLVKYSQRHQNLIITPHIGGATPESMEKTEIYIAQKVKEVWLT